MIKCFAILAVLSVVVPAFPPASAGPPMAISRVIRSKVYVLFNGDLIKKHSGLLDQLDLRGYGIMNEESKKTYKALPLPFPPPEESRGTAVSDMMTE